MKGPGQGSDQVPPPAPRVDRLEERPRPRGARPLEDVATSIRRGVQQRRKLADLLELTEEEARILEQWQYWGAHDALRLFLLQLCKPEAIPKVVRRPGPDGKTLVDVLLEEGPGAVVAFLDREQREINEQMLCGG